MTLQEKSMYQQIHPLRLTVDWVTGLTACYLFWLHDMVNGLIVAFIPSLLVSLFVIRFGELEKLKNSSFGKYYKRTYSKTIDLVRFGGFVIMSGSAWYNFAEGIVGGIVVVIATWTYGMFLKKEQ